MENFSRGDVFPPSLTFDDRRDDVPVDFSLKESAHAGGCACSVCQGLENDDKDYIPGDGTVSAEDTIPANTSTTATLNPGGFVTSAIDTSGDSDWFRITLEAGETYVFSTYLFGGGLPDSILTLRSSTGAVLEVNDDANTAEGLYYSEITFTASSSGTYYLDVTGFSTATGTYILSSSRPQDDAIAGDATTTASLEIGADAVAGTFEQTGDHDWYAVTLEAGTIYEFVTSATPNSDDADTTLTLRDASGNVLAYNDDSSGTYSRIRVEVETSGTYYVDVGSWAESDAGSYQIAAFEAPPLELFTNDQIADQLLNGYWGGPNAARRFDVSEGGNLTVNLTALTAAGQNLAREALFLWGDVMGITFSEVTSGGQIQFDDSQSGAFAGTTRSGEFIVSAEVNVDASWISLYGDTLDSYTFQAFVHEIGHALGLGHAGNYNSNASYTQDANYLNDSWATTVMSYFSQSENGYFEDLGYSEAFVLTPMSADVVAIQTAYGAATSTRTGDNVYGFGNDTGRESFGVGAEATNSQGRLLAFTIVDHGGTDTLNYSNFTAGQLINLNEETFSNVGGSIGNMSIARGTVIENAIGGSANDILIGNDVANLLTGGRGNDTINGGSNVDTAIVSGNRSAYTITQTSTGVFRVVGTDGTDTLTNVEFLQFDDQTMRLLPGVGVTVNFETADPSVYQDDLNALRDFDGNFLGGGGAWLRIGSADVDGDGDVDQILVNDAIGRFATVGGSDDGLVYFDDHGWAGETRVVGIYIDPLVESGDVVQGGPNDSQRRFQNDLEIENINRVLGADDYDGDGLQEVYLALTDGTAYLHLYMHADGNIQYANYQSEQQVIDYLTANGFTAETWADWFPADAETPNLKAEEPTAMARPEPLAIAPFDHWDMTSTMSELVQPALTPVTEVFA